MSVDKNRTLFHTEIIINHAENYEYSTEKDKWLLETRGVGFRDVIAAIHDGQVFDIIDHHNPAKYPNQKIYVVLIDDYVCQVPFVRKDNNILFLKTIFRTRKLKKYYLGK